MISKAKSRCTTCAGNRFRYKVSAKPRSKGVYELNITVQSEDHNGSKLTVNGIIQHDCNVIPLKHSEDYQYRPEIIKADIDGFISEAIMLGWEYDAPGKNFKLQASNDIFTNPFLEGHPEGFFQGRHFQKNK